MAHNPNFKPVLLTSEQMEAVKRIHQQERDKSPVSAAPSISAIVRGLVDKGLQQVAGNA